MAGKEFTRRFLQIPHAMLTTKPKTSPAIRAIIYSRLKAGEKAAHLAGEYGITRQLVSLIQIRYKKAEAAGEDATARKRRDLTKLIPQKLEALRLIVTTKTPAEMGYDSFSGWNYRAAQKVMEDLLHFKMLRPEMEHFLTQWGALTPARWTAQGGYIPATGDMKPRWPRKEEVFEQDFYDYINSDIGRQVAAKSKEWEERERKEREEAIANGWVRKRGRPRNPPPPTPAAGPALGATPAQAPAPTPAPGPATVPAKPAPRKQSILTSEEIERRLDEARKLIGDNKVQDVLDHYSPAPKKRGSNYTPPKKKRRK